MRIHTNELTREDIELVYAPNLPGVYLEISEHKSGTHTRAFEVYLTGNSSHRSQRDRNEYAATWDEWGVFLARLFALDPYMRCGSKKYPVYESSGDFHYKTGNRFKSYYALPDDTHKQHNWVFSVPGVFKCKTCSAVRCHSF